MLRLLGRKLLLTWCYQMETLQETGSRWEREVEGSNVFLFLTCSRQLNIKLFLSSSGPGDGQVRVRKLRVRSESGELKDLYIKRYQTSLNSWLYLGQGTLYKQSPTGHVCLFVCLLACLLACMLACPSPSQKSKVKTQRTWADTKIT